MCQSLHARVGEVREESIVRAVCTGMQGQRQQ